MPNHLLFYLSLLGYLGLTAARFIFRLPMGRKLLIPVWLIHTACLIQRMIASGHLPLSGLFEPLNFFVWCILGLSIISYHAESQDITLLITASLMLVATAVPKEIRPLPEGLNTIWFELHVSSAFIAYAFFALAAAACVAPGFIPGWFGKEQALESIPGQISGGQAPALRSDDSGRSLKLTAWGVFIFSASMLAGGIWAYLAWADYWVWTPKELWSVLIWIHFATILHAARLPEWRGWVSRMIVLGFILLMFTYLGVGLLMKSSHPL